MVAATIPIFVVSKAPVLTPEHCASIIAAAESASITSTNTTNGWDASSSDRQHLGYAQATADIEVDQHPAVAEAVTAGGHLARAVEDQLHHYHQKRIYALDDIFIVKYDATHGTGQRALLPHTDGGDLSFMIALSPPSAYTGGGTEFFLSEPVRTLSTASDCTFHTIDHPRLTEQQGRDAPMSTAKKRKQQQPPPKSEVVHLDQGHCISFRAKTMHKGVAITSGLRYLLVGFCHTEESVILLLLLLPTCVLVLCSS